MTAQESPTLQGNIVTVELLDSLFETMKKHKVAHLKMSNMEIALSPSAFFETFTDAPPLPGNQTTFPELY
jgi:hypothetical protein